jgi:hypothetical protein
MQEIMYFSIGSATIKQYGLTLDDFTQYVIGKVNYEYINGERTKINPEIDHFYQFLRPTAFRIYYE